MTPGAQRIGAIASSAAAASGSLFSLTAGAERERNKHSSPPDQSDPGEASEFWSSRRSGLMQNYANALPRAQWGNVISSCAEPPIFLLLFQRLRLARPLLSPSASAEKVVYSGAVVGGPWGFGDLGRGAFLSSRRGSRHGFSSRLVSSVLSPLPSVPVVPLSLLSLSFPCREWLEAQGHEASKQVQPKG